MLASSNNAKLCPWMLVQRPYRKVQNAIRSRLRPRADRWGTEILAERSTGTQKHLLKSTQNPHSSRNRNRRSPPSSRRRRDHCRHAVPYERGGGGRKAASGGMGHHAAAAIPPAVQKAGGCGWPRTPQLPSSVVAGGAGGIECHAIRVRHSLPCPRRP